MPHTRKADQKVDAFSAPIELLSEAAARAAVMGLTRSGFYRYCLAKELGYSEAQAKEIAQHKAVANSIESRRNSERFIASRGKMGAAKIYAEIEGTPAASPLSPKAPLPSDKTAGPSSRNRPHQGRRRTPPSQAPK